jgi:hypothetical protein
MKRNDLSLKDALSHLRVPTVETSDCDLALARALTALKQPDRSAVVRQSRRWVIPLSSLAGATGLAAILLFFSVSEPPASQNHTAEVFEEMSLLFPQQLEAVIEKEGEVDVRLTEAPVDLHDDQGLRIEVDRGDDSLVVYTFSGNEVCLDLDGTSFCFTPLITGDGSVLVVTDDEVIEDFEKSDVRGFRISAKRHTS